MQVSKPKLVVETREEEHYHSKFNSSYSDDEEEDLDEEELMCRTTEYGMGQDEDEQEEDMAELQRAIEASLQVAVLESQQKPVEPSSVVKTSNIEEAEEDSVDFELVPQSDSSTTEVAPAGGMEDEEEEDWSVLLDEADDGNSNEEDLDETSSQWTMADILSQCDQHSQHQQTFKHVLMAAMSNSSASSSSNGTIMRRVSPSSYLLASAVRTFSHNSNGGIQSIPEDAELDDQEHDNLDDGEGDNDCDFEGTYLIAKSGGLDKVVHNTHSNNRGSQNKPPKRSNKAKSKQKGAKKNSRRNQ